MLFDFTYNYYQMKIFLMICQGDEFRDGQSYIDLWGYKVRNGSSISYQPGAPVQSPKKQNSKIQ